MSGMVRAAACTGVALAAALLTPAADADDWYRLETAHHEIVGDAETESFVAVARDLERFRRTLERFPGGLELRPRRPLVIYLFRDWRSSRGMLPEQWRDDVPGGLFLDSPEGATIAIHASPEHSTASLVFHEYAHYVLSQSLPDAPLWFNEGLAELLTPLRLTGHEALVGLPQPRYVSLLSGGLPFSSEQLRAVAADSEVYRDPARKQAFHAQAWAEVHWRLLGPERVASPTALLAGLRRGEALAPLSDSARRSLPGYVAGLEERALRIEIEPHGIERRACEPLSRSQIRRRRGDLLAAFGEHERAIVLYRRALRADARNVWARAGLARALDRQGRRDEAIAQLRRAVADDPDDSRLRRRLEGLQARDD